jgi:5-methylthioadenosine/S-adenosylhomocysteine deaminase
MAGNDTLAAGAGPRVGGAEVRGLFDSSYAAGLTRELPPPPAERDPATGELGVRAAPAEPLALRGCVVTPERQLKDGYVVLGEAREIAAVQTRRPEGVKVRETDGVILPGLIDLHGHPEFNVFSAWEPPRLYPNRHAWRDDEIYEKYVKQPENELLSALPRQTQLRYAEIRALVGGVTAIQGTSENVRTLGPGEALVRNVDRWVFGEQRGRALIDLPSGSRGISTLRNVLAEIEAPAR